MNQINDEIMDVNMKIRKIIVYVDYGLKLVNAYIVVRVLLIIYFFIEPHLLPYT
jgi:hypothetical protein